MALYLPLAFIGLVIVYAAVNMMSQSARWRLARLNRPNAVVPDSWLDRRIERFKRDIDNWN